MEREGEGVKHLCAREIGGLTHNRGLCPDWESNQKPSVHRPALSPLSHTCQGQFFISKSSKLREEEYKKALINPLPRFNI